MSNIENLEKSITDAKRQRFSIYDNPDSSNKKIIIETDTNILNIVKIANNKVNTCTCESEKPCKHMIKIAMKYNIDVDFNPEKIKKTKTTKKNKESPLDKVINLK